MSEQKKYELLESINSPDDLKKLPSKQLDKLNAEIREFLIENISKTGGHLASNLGVVELSVALHRVFSTPKDHIVWDVGHQSYVHKILTGRRDKFTELRCPGGISGFENRSESEHDCFGTGHSSTSLSAAVGIAEADALCGENDRYTVAVVGDGAFTGGMIHEALNNCERKLKLVIVLNENEMSISRNIGHFATNLSKLRSTRGYGKTKRFTRRFVSRIPFVGRFLFRAIRTLKKSVKNAIYGSNYFEDLGLFYIGPLDGNDVSQVESALFNAKEQGENVIVHIKTKKGKGYAPAEENPNLYHSMTSQKCTAHSGMTFSEVFGKKLTKMADSDDKICAITAAMCDGTGLNPFREKHTRRFFDVGIAEEHALTFAAGLAAEGMKPCVAIYSTFLQRGYDNIIHDIALQNLPVKIFIDRAGLNSSDGATHHGIFDVSFLSGVPGLTLYHPITNASLEAAIEETILCETPCAVRYASGREDSEIVSAFFGENSYGTQNVGIRSLLAEKSEPDVLIVTHGRIVKEALSAVKSLEAEGISCGIVLVEKIKPYGECADNIIPYLPKKNGKLIFVEEEIRNGGMGMILSDELYKRGALKEYSYKILALDDSFAQQDKPEHIYKTAGVSADDIIKACR